MHNNDCALERGVLEYSLTLNCSRNQHLAAIALIILPLEQIFFRPVSLPLATSQGWHSATYTQQDAHGRECFRISLQLSSYIPFHCSVRGREAPRLTLVSYTIPACQVFLQEHPSWRTSSPIKKC